MPLDSQTKVIKMVLLFNALLEYSLVWTYGSLLFPLVILAQNRVVLIHIESFTHITCSYSQWRGLGQQRMGLLPDT